MRRNLLAIFPQLPLPEYSGDRQKVNNLLKILSKIYNLHVIIICRENASIENLEFLKAHCISYKIFKLSKAEIIINLAKGFFTKEPLQVTYFYSESIQKYVELIAKSVDFVFCNLIRVAKYAYNLDIEKHIDIVDSLSINYKKSYANVSSLIWKIIYIIEYKKLQLFEIEIINKFNSSFLVNYLEKEQLDKQLQSGKIYWLPQGIKQELFKYSKIDNSYKKSVMFIGKMNYQPNEDAVMWFLKHVWSSIYSDATFYIVGINPSKKVMRQCKKYKNVQLKGYMEDPYIIMNSCNIVVSPMQTGGGVQNKILEAMALGKINITTTRGAESIRYAENLKHLLIANSPSEFITLINDVLENDTKFNSIKLSAKNLVSEIYTWSNFETNLISVLKCS